MLEKPHNPAAILQLGVKNHHVAPLLLTVHFEDDRRRSRQRRVMIRFKDARILPDLRNGNHPAIYKQMDIDVR